MGALEQLSTNIFPEAVKAGSFGQDVKKFVSFQVKTDQKGTDQRCSEVTFGDVTIEKETGERIVQSVVIKTRQIPEVKGVVDFDLVFPNEVLFYAKIIPALQKYDKDGVLKTCLSEFVYGKATGGEHPEEDIVILKNLKDRDFQLSKERLLLDEKHIKLALDRLGRIHALSLAYQKDDPEGFDQLISQIKVVFPMDTTSYSFMPIETFIQFLLRGVEPLKDDPDYRERLSDIRKIFENNAIEHYRKCCMPSKSLSVLCLGDFHRNNIMFSYGENGDPVEVAFFDFQFIRFSSPALDLSVLLTTNVSPEVRSSFWNMFLRTYHDALTNLQLRGFPEKPSLEAVEQELREKGAHGYYVSSFFIPMMVAQIGGDDVSGTKPQDWEGHQEEELKEYIEKNRAGLQTMGGVRATQLLVGIVKHMLDKGYNFKP